MCTCESCSVTTSSRAPRSDSRTQGVVVEQPPHGAGHRVALDRHDQRLALIADLLVHPRQVRQHARRAAGHRLEHRTRGGVRGGDRDAHVRDTVIGGHALVVDVADHVHALLVGELAERLAHHAHVLEHELDIGALVGDLRPAVDDHLRVVDRHQRARAQHHRPVAEPELVAQRGAVVGGLERVHVDAPVDQHAVLGRGAELDAAVHQRLRVGHHERGALERVAVRERLQRPGAQDVRAPGHRHQRLRAGERGQERVAGQPVRVHDVRLLAAQQPANPADVRRRPVGEAAPAGGAV